MRLLVSLLLVLVPTVSWSQDKSDATRQIQCRFLSFGGANTPSAVNAVGPKGDKISCPLSSKSISDPVTCPALANKITFVGVDDEKPVASVTIPSGVRAAILVFVPSPKSTKPGLPMKVLLIEDSAKSFPDGGVYVANFHPDDIRFIIGEHKGGLHPGKARGYARPDKRDSFNMAPVVFEFLNEDKWRKGNESALRFLPGMRYLIFAYTDPASKRPRINTYQDFKSVAASDP